MRERWGTEGFWLEFGEPASISGSDPMELIHGPANGT